MRRNIGMLTLTLLILLLVWAPAQAKNRGRRPKKIKNNGEWCVKAGKAQKGKGIELKCGSSGSGSKIADLSVAGVKGQCRGLTADMFVQTYSCLWKEACSIKKKKHDRYMVKLFSGTPAECITESPKQFHIIYHCSAADVRVVDVLSGSREDITERRGIVRSHEDHPWMYRRHHYFQYSNVTLHKPESDPMKFAYTIRTLKLMWNDVLIVNSTGRRNDVTTYDHTVTNKTLEVIEGADQVTFQLETSSYSTGGEGFVICFQWLQGGASVTDACSGMLVPGSKTSKIMRPCKKNRGRRGGKSNKKKKKKASRAST